MEGILRVIRGGCSWVSSFKAEESVLGRKMEAAVGGRRARQGVGLEAVELLIWLVNYKY